METMTIHVVSEIIHDLWLNSISWFNENMLHPSTGEGNYSVMDMLGASGLVNYFGKVPNLEKLTYQPLLFQKGETYVAIYGIGSMNDDRLFRLFQEEKVNQINASRCSAMLFIWYRPTGHF